MCSFSYLEPVCCSMSSSNYCFLTCIQMSQEAGQVVWYSHLLKNFPQFVVIHIVKGFGIVNKAEVDVFLEFSCFYSDPTDVGNLISDSCTFSKSSLNIWKFTVHVLLKPALENFEHFLEKEMATHSSTLAWKTPWMETPGGLQSMESQRVGTTERLHFLLSLLACEMSTIVR